ncbi:hypothetical protein FRC06_003146 [Ceratobasidium sp. 370]|nr:hypothetical protein FRC06_003146 [Ceratobasidium sp. 370]
MSGRHGSLSPAAYLTAYVGKAKDGDELGTVYLTEIYSSPQGLADFCKTSEHDAMKERLMPIIQADKLVITQVVTNGEFSK